jgi:hypothetical protein
LGLGWNEDVFAIIILFVRYIWVDSKILLRKLLINGELLLGKENAFYFRGLLVDLLISTSPSSNEKPCGVLIKWITDFIKIIYVEFKNTWVRFIDSETGSYNIIRIHCLADQCSSRLWISYQLSYLFWCFSKMLLAATAGRFRLCSGHRTYSPATLCFISWSIFKILIRFFSINLR